VVGLVGANWRATYEYSQFTIAYRVREKQMNESRHHGAMKRDQRRDSRRDAADVPVAAGTDFNHKHLQRTAPRIAFTS